MPKTEKLSDFNREGFSDTRYYETFLGDLESEAISPPYGCHLQSKASPIVFHASFSHLSRFHYTFHISCFTKWKS